MNDDDRAKKMAESLRQLYCETDDADSFAAVAQTRFYIDKFTAHLSWRLIDAVAVRGIE